ncbi:MotA/TolQ/ExbB proton channel family protein [Aurantivibrio plasticivorans]
MIDVYSKITAFFQDGGLFIYPIAIVLAIGIGIAIERWLFLAREKARNLKAFNDFLPLLRSTDIEKMQLYTREVQTPVTRIIGCGLDMMKVSKQRGDIENSMSEGMLETMPQLQNRTGYLAVLANVATLLGLLGTIIGLISAFTAVAVADPAQKSTLLSQSISVAMNTTAFGLIAAIPLLVLHAVIQNKTSAIVNSIEMAAVKFLNIMTLHRFIEASIARPSSGMTITPDAQASAEADLVNRTDGAAPAPAF